MNKLSFLFLFALLFTFASCEDDDMLGGGGGSMGNEPEILDCNPSTDITLTDRNPDGIDYIIDCRYFEILGVNVTIQPGVEIQMNSGSTVRVSQEGSLSAVGTNESKIIIRGEGGGTAASWGYIYFNTNNINNRLDHVVIENGGTEDLLFFDRTTVAVEGALSMSNTTISYSGGNGFATGEALESTRLPEFRNNIFTDNTDYPISVTQNQGEDLDLMSCTFSGNGKSFIEIGRNSSGGARLDEEATWGRGPIPYFVKSQIDIQEGLTIEAGAELVFNSGAWLGVIDYTNDSYLTVNGTEDNHVIMRGEVSTEGAWPGLVIKTPNVKNVFNYLDLSDGGQTFQTTFDIGKGNVTIYREGSKLTMNNCTSTRAECDVVIDNTFCCVDFTNNSPAVTAICE